MPLIVPPPTPPEKLVKGWINFNGTGTVAINNSFNVASLVDNGTGDYTINWDTDFADANYAVSASVSGSDAYPRIHGVGSGTIAAGSVRIETLNFSAVNVDMQLVTVMAIGDQ